MTSSSTFGSPAAAQNGMGWNAVSGQLEMGGDLIRPTAINTSPVNLLSLTGLTGGNPATDVMLVVDPTGAIKFIALTGLNDFWRSGTGATTPDGVTDDTEIISRSGNVGIGIVDPTTVRARLDVNGSVIHRASSLPNFAANGAIGTAVATVDAASVILINQATANIALTLPNPTNAQNGRLLIVGNIGTQAVTVGGQVVNPATAIPFVWSGAAWLPMGSAPADFWRTVANALPDNVTDTTDSIRRLGNVGIGGATITEAMPTVGAPSATNNILHLSGAAANRGQLFFGNSPLSYYLERTMPTVVGDYVEIGSMNGTANGHNLIISLAVHDGNFAVDKLYVVAANYGATGGQWRVLAPLTDGGPYGGNNFELLMNVGNGLISLRVRRTAGATAGTLRVRIQQLSDPRTTLTESATTGADATVYATHYPFQADWSLLGNTGTTNTAYADAAAQLNNFIGTLDNQPVSIYTNAGNANAKTDLKLFTSTPIGQAIVAPTDVFHIRRNGQTGIAAPQIFTVALGKWLADGNGRTRVDFKLLNGGGAVADATIMSLFSQGGVGITGLGTPATGWTMQANLGVSRGNGFGLLGLAGANGSGAGPHISVWTTADTYPLFHQLNWTHDNSGLFFDGYYDGQWRAGHTSRPFGIYKLNGVLSFSGSAAAPAAAGSAWTQETIMRLRYAGATLAGGELDFNNVIKNRRIVLFDANAASDHQFYGFGINRSILRYQVDQPGSNHVWFAGTAAATSVELMRLTGTGNLGIGGITPTTRLDVSGPVTMRSVAIADIGANGAVGTTAATVDAGSVLVLNQATSNIALTLPGPGNGTGGRLLFVTHNGAATGVTINGKTISPGETLSFIWDGNSWNPPAYVPPTTRAYVYATSAGAAINNAAATLANWTEAADAGNNHAAGIFTAPRAGLYQVNAMVTYTAAAWNATTYAQITVQVNGADRHQGTTTVEAAGNKIISASVGATVQLTAGQTLQITLYQNSGAAKTPAGGINSYYTIVEL